MRGRTLHIHPVLNGEWNDMVLVVTRVQGSITAKRIMERDRIFALISHPSVRNHYDDIIHHMDRLGHHLTSV